MANKALITEEILQHLPQLKYIGVVATGYNNIDIEAARKRNIIVTNVKAYGPASVAQHTFALILAFTNRIETHSQSVHAGDWSHSPDFCYWKSPLTELQDKTLGLIGLGDIGSQVAKIATAMGMKVIAYRKNPSLTKQGDITMVSLEELFKISDVVSLHCPLTEETKGIINKNTLSTMKSNAILINTGRGPLIVEEDLAQALNKGVIGGAGLDVLSVEPPKADNPLLNAVNCLITPHIAWASVEARARLMVMVADNFKAFEKGTPQSVVS